MDKHNVVKFLNQFIRTIKKDVKSIGIITDKDGTILLNDILKETLRNFREKNLGVDIHIIANSGRTVQDMINCLKEQDIPTNYFDYIIGDNGGMCLEVKNNKELYKHVMDKDVVIKVMKKFIEMGANPSLFRMVDGENIFAYPSSDVKEYYKDNKSVVYREDILNLDDIDITKLTLAGSHEQISKINKFIEENIKGYKTHMGKTSFPNKSSNNYRLDFTRNAYKRCCC